MKTVAWVALGLAGCGSAGGAQETSAQEPTIAAAPQSAGAEQPSDTGMALDDPRISRSAGREDGVVVLWPRVVGAVVA